MSSPPGSSGVRLGVSSRLEKPRAPSGRRPAHMLDQPPLLVLTNSSADAPPEKPPAGAPSPGWKQNFICQQGPVIQHRDPRTSLEDGAHLYVCVCVLGRFQLAE